MRWQYLLVFALGWGLVPEAKAQYAMTPQQYQQWLQQQQKQYQQQAKWAQNHINNNRQRYGNYQYQPLIVRPVPLPSLPASKWRPNGGLWQTWHQFPR